MKRTKMLAYCPRCRRLTDHHRVARVKVLGVLKCHVCRKTHE